MPDPLPRNLQLTRAALLEIIDEYLAPKRRTPVTARQRMAQAAQRMAEADEKAAFALAVLALTALRTYYAAGQQP